MTRDNVLVDRRSGLYSTESAEMVKVPINGEVSATIE
jgi:hypothetical protein